MSDTIRICPLRLAAYDGNSEGPRTFRGEYLVSLVDAETCACLEEQCAWYDGVGHRCAIAVIPMALDALNSQPIGF